MKGIFETNRHLSGKPENRNLCVVSHFFNSRGHLLEHSAKGMLHAILHQLCTFHPICIDSFQSYTEQDLHLLESRDPSSYLSVLTAALTRIMSDKSLAPFKTIMIVDALDECDHTEATNVGYYLSELTESARRAGVQLNVCISRREYPHITIRDCLQIHMEQHNEGDIRHYIHQKLALTNLSTEDAITLQDTIAARSNGIFLWAVLAVETILKDVENGRNSKYILNRTKALPKALEDLFRQMLENMDPEDLGTALGVFHWAVLATEPLRIREWHHILAFLRHKRPLSLKEWKESAYYTETDGQLERQIKSLSQGLVEVKTGRDEKLNWTEDTGSVLAGAGSLDSTAGDSRVVQPIHETVIEFFVSGRANQLLKQQTNYNFAAEGHLFIMGVCLDYIAVAELDELAAARRRGQMQKGSKIRHKRSATSFMSSASAHSSKYYTSDNDDALSFQSYWSDSSDDIEGNESADENYQLDNVLPLPHGDEVSENLRPTDFHGKPASLSKLHISRDAAFPDGYVNLRVDITAAIRSGMLPLYHFRMDDMSKRAFRLDRYIHDPSDKLSFAKQKSAAYRHISAFQASRTDPTEEFIETYQKFSSLPACKLRRDSKVGSRPINKDANETLTQTSYVRLDIDGESTIRIACRVRKHHQVWHFAFRGHSYQWMRRAGKEGQSPAFTCFDVTYSMFSGENVARMVPQKEKFSTVGKGDIAGDWIPPCSLKIQPSALERLKDERTLAE